MRITKIERQKKNPRRRSIYVDGEYRVGVSDETLLRFGLRTGDELPPETLSALQDAESLINAKQSALRFLSYRPRTEREVRDKLREKEFPDTDIRATIDELKRSGLLNDREFAHMFVRDAIRKRPTGRTALRRRMLLLGLDRQTIDEALAEECTDEQSTDLALQAARGFLKRAGQASARKKEDPAKLRNRLAQFLARRGFPWDIIQPVLKQVLHPSDSEE